MDEWIPTPRRYRDSRDLELMRSVLVAGRMAGTQAYYVHPGDLYWWLFYLNQDDDPQEHAFLWEGPPPTREVIGWSLFSPRFLAFDLFIHPQHHGSAITESMLAWTVKRGREMVLAGRGNTLQTVWISEHDEAYIGQLERLGFERANFHYIYMSRDLDGPLPEPVVPAEFSVRHVAGEHEGIQRAAVAYAAFEAAQPFDAYARKYLHFMRSQVYKPELDLVAVASDGRFGAFCICWLDSLSRVGLIEPAGTHPDFQRRGLGKAVVQEGLRRMVAFGMTEAMVCVEHDNLAAQALYRSVGFHAHHRIDTYTYRL